MRVATVLTVYGIETLVQLQLLHSGFHTLQQHLPFTVCAEGCETAEEQSDDEVRTSQVPERREGKTKAISNSTYRLRYAPKSVRQQRSSVTMRSALLLPERSEGKTKVIRQQYLPFTVLKRAIHQSPLMVSINLVATAYGMRRRVRDSRGAKRR